LEGEQRREATNLEVVLNFIIAEEQKRRMSSNWGNPANGKIALPYVRALIAIESINGAKEACNYIDKFIM
jgi:hypothetical protein